MSCLGCGRHLGTATLSGGRVELLPCMSCGRDPGTPSWPADPGPDPEPQLLSGCQAILLTCLLSLLLVGVLVAVAVL